MVSSVVIASYSNSRGPELKGIHLDCTECKKSVVIPVSLTLSDTVNAVYRGKCPSCKFIYEFFARLSFQNNTTNNPIQIEELFVYPDTKFRRIPRVTPAELKSEKLYKAYVNTLDALNKDAVGAVPAVARRTLEGIVKGQLAERGITPKGRMLGQILTELTDNVDLSTSLKDLARVLTEGGNVGAHFDEDLDDPTPEFAAKMVDLLEAVIEYFYVLPAQIEDFKVYITKKPVSPADET